MGGARGRPAAGPLGRVNVEVGALSSPFLSCSLAPPALFSVPSRLPVVPALVSFAVALVRPPLVHVVFVVFVPLALLLLLLLFILRVRQQV